MKVPNYIYIILFLIIIIFLVVFGIWIINPIEPIIFFEYPYFIILALVGTFIVNIIIEYYIFCYYLSKSVELDKSELFLSVFLVNLITFPPNQLAFYFFFVFFPTFVIFYFNILFQIIVITIEWLLYRFEFKKLFLSSRRIFSISAGGNIGSFLTVSIILSYLLNLAFPIS